MNLSPLLKTAITGTNKGLKSYLCKYLLVCEGGEKRARKKQKKASKAELLQEAEKNLAERQQLAGSAEGQVGSISSLLK